MIYLTTRLSYFEVYILFKKVFYFHFLSQQDSSVGITLAWYVAGCWFDPRQRKSISLYLSFYILQDRKIDHVLPRYGPFYSFTYGYSLPCNVS